jgi:hypothetical protein
MKRLNGLIGLIEMTEMTGAGGRKMKSPVALAWKMLAAVLALSAARTEAQTGKLAAAAPVNYDNRFEVYGGLNYMNFQAGQSVPKLMNLGGAEVSITYWVTPRWGAVGDVRGDAGTSPVFANPVFNGRALVVLYTGMAGAEYRVKQNERAAFDLHALAGVSHGKFDYTTTQNQTGFYNNPTKPLFALGGSIDVNRSKNVAIRLQPDLILEHYGTELREFFSISGGVLYRFGQR